MANTRPKRGSQKPMRDARILRMAESGDFTWSELAEFFQLHVSRIGVILRRERSKRKETTT